MSVMQMSVVQNVCHETVYRITCLQASVLGVTHCFTMFEYKVHYSGSVEAASLRYCWLLHLR